MMKFVITTLCLVAVAHGYEVSSQYHKQDGLGGYAYGYEDPNSQKQEMRAAHGVIHGGYSYLDGSGQVQHLKYVADPKTGFHVIGGTNLPEAPTAGATPYSGGASAHYTQGPHANIVIGKGGVPIDTPEVQQARAQHLAALSQAHFGGSHHLSRRSVPVAPIDTPEVQNAKAAHYAAYTAAASQTQGYTTGPIKHIVIPHHGPQHYPVLHKGVPLDTPEVQSERVKHFNAWSANYRPGSGAEESFGQSGNADSGFNAKYYQPAAAPVHATSAATGYETTNQAYKGPIHIPVIHAGGVPVDTPEVQHARSSHLAALQKAHAEAAQYGYNQREEEGGNGGDGGDEGGQGGQGGNRNWY